MTALKLESLEQLCKVLNELPKSSPIQVSQVVALGLDEIAERVGARRWERMKGLVGSFVESAIKAHSGPNDSFMKCLDGNYVIVFPGVDMDAALVRAGKIAMQVNDTLFGQMGFEGASLRPIVSDGNEWRASERITPTEIATKLEENALRLAKEFAEEQARNINEQTAQGAQEASSLDEAEARRVRKQSFMLEMSDVERNPIHNRFVPVWSMPSQSISAFLCQPSCRIPYQDEPAFGYDTLSFHPNPPDICNLDVDALETGLIALKKAMSAGHKVDVVFNLHFETLSSNRGRQEVVSILRLAPPIMRQRIFVNLCGLPQGIPPGRFMEISQYLSPFFRGTCVAVQHETQKGNIKAAMARLLSSGVKVLGVNLAPMPTRTDWDWSLATLKTAREMGFVSFIGNIRKWEDVRQFAKGGVQLISGPVLGASSESLPEPVRLTAVDVERHCTDSAEVDATLPLFATGH